MGRDKRIRVQFGSVRSARLREGEDGTRPNVPEGSAIEYVAQRPAAREVLDEECPDRSDGNTSRASRVEVEVRLKEICGDVSVHINDTMFSIGFGKGKDGGGYVDKGQERAGGKAERGG